MARRLRIASCAKTRPPEVGLVRYHVLFIIDIATRGVCIGGISSDPHADWMKQAVRTLTGMWDGVLLGKRYLLHDRDPLFTEVVQNGTTKVATTS